MFLFLNVILAKGTFSGLFDFLKFDNYENFVDRARYDADINTEDPSLLELMKTEFVVFGTETCGFTKKALGLLKDKGVSYVFVDKDKNMTNTYETLKSTLQHDTLPLIIHNKRFLGGYGKLIKYFENPMNNSDSTQDSYRKYYENYYKGYYGNAYNNSESTNYSSQ